MKGALLVGLFVLSQGQLLHKSNADHDLLSYGDFGNRINQNNLPSSEDKQSVSSISNLRQPRQLQQQPIQSNSLSNQTKEDNANSQQDTKKQSLSEAEDTTISFVSSRYHKLIDIPPTINMDNENESHPPQSYDQINAWKIIGYIFLIWILISILPIPFLWLSIRRTRKEQRNQRLNKMLKNAFTQMADAENIVSDIRLIRNQKPQIVLSREVNPEKFERGEKVEMKQEESVQSNEGGCVEKQLQIDQIHEQNSQSESQKENQEEYNYFSAPKMSNLLEKESYIAEPAIACSEKKGPEQYGTPFSFSQIRTPDEGEEQKKVVDQSMRSREEKELSEIYKAKESEISENNQINAIIEWSRVEEKHQKLAELPTSEDLKRGFQKDRDNQQHILIQQTGLNQSFENFVNSQPLDLEVQKEPEDNASQPTSPQLEDGDYL